VLTVTYGNASNTLTWTAATDATTTVAGYKVVYATGTVAPASCAVGTVASASATSGYVHAGLTNGTAYAYRLCAVDAAGNVATGVTGVAQPRPESAGPVGSVSINGGAAWTNATTVTLALSATDASTVTSVCVSLTATCTAWVPYAASLPFTLTTTPGARTVNIWFRDEWSNVSAMVSASIGLDLTAPVQPTLAGTAGSKSASLTWAAATDATSGVATYKLVFLAGTTAPAAGCTNGAVVSSGAVAATVSHTGLVGGAAYTYRLCVVDVAGNVSAGSTKVLTTLP
jgi:hypothetical protein